MLACGKRGRAFVAYRSSCVKTTLEASRPQGLDQTPGPRSRFHGGLARKSPLPREARTALGPAWFALERLCRGLVSGVEAADVVHPRFVTLLCFGVRGWDGTLSTSSIGANEFCSNRTEEEERNGFGAHGKHRALITLFAFFYLAWHGDEMRNISGPAVRNFD